MQSSKSDKAALPSEGLLERRDMEHTEAIKILKELNENYFQPDEQGQFDDVNECLTDAIEALEKQIPKEPMKISLKPRNSFDYVCNCGYVFISRIRGQWVAGKKDSYCPRCGQKTYWNDFDGKE